MRVDKNGGGGQTIPAQDAHRRVKGQTTFLPTTWFSWQARRDSNPQLPDLESFPNITFRISYVIKSLTDNLFPAKNIREASKNAFFLWDQCGTGKLIFKFAVFLFRRIGLMESLRKRVLDSLPRE